MKKTKLSIYISLLIVLIPFGCSIKKDKLLNRTYHWVTARYNKYYNAKVLFDEKTTLYKEQIKDDYNIILPTRKVGTEEEAKALFSSMEQVIEKCNGVVSSHSMKIKGEERNDWIDETFLLLGKAYFYKQEYEKASQIFNHIKKYNNLSKNVTLKVWSAETQVMLGNYTLAEKQLEDIVENEFLKKEHKIHILETRAELYKRDNNIKRASIALEKTIKYLPNKGDHIGRNFFILGQYALELYDLENANVFFYEAERRGKSYELVFNAILAQTRAYNPDFSIAEELFKSLNKLEKETQNKDRLDQIYYAKGELHEKLEDYPLALENYQNSIDSNKTNTLQLARSHLAKGALEFKLQNYETAQLHYDEAMNIIDEKYPNYYGIEQKWKSLSELANEYSKISLFDSLLIVSDWSKENQYNFAKELAYRLIKEKKDKEEAKEVLQAKLNAKIDLSTSKKNTNWYFDNETLLQKGKKLFKDAWGERNLEDNWRRTNKESIDEEDIEEEEDNETVKEETEIVSNDSIPADVKEKLEEILAKIPHNNSEKEDLQQEIGTAYFTLGMIYKEQLKDYPEAITNFTTLLSKIPNTKHKPAAHYHLFRLFSFVKQKNKSDVHKNKILKDYPKSVFASLINNTGNKENQKDIDEDKYTKYYSLFKAKNYKTVLDSVKTFLTENPTSKLAPNMSLLVAEATGNLYGREKYIEALKATLSNHPDSKQGTIADEKIKLLTSTKSNLNIDIYDNKIETKYFVALLVDRKNSSKVENFISDFKQSTFKNDNLKSSSLIFNDDLKMVSVKLFKDAKHAYQFISVMKYDEYYTQNKNSIKHSLVLSTKNYSLFYKRKKIDEYKAFMKKYLSKFE